jgi:homoserine kinase
MCYVDMRSPWDRSVTSDPIAITQQTSSTFAPFIIALSEEDKEALRAMIRDVVTEAVREELHKLRKDHEHRENQ